MLDISAVIMSLIDKKEQSATNDGIPFNPKSLIVHFAISVISLTLLIVLLITGVYQASLQSKLNEKRILHVEAVINEKGNDIRKIYAVVQQQQEENKMYRAGAKAYMQKTTKDIDYLVKSNKNK